MAEIIQSQNDKRKYKAIKLSNNLEALLIQDEETDKSSASLDVHIGQLEDPEKNQGIAHFCEHMLFMGTKKYPVQNEYSAFISKNSGSENAFTDLSDTNYYFDVANEGFEQTLDMFAQFFTTPLFDETCVEKEINAVESEHQMGLTNDDCRNWQLFKDTAKPGNFKQNGGGNLNTLQSPTIRQDLLEFYDKYYSSNLMKLVIYSKESLEQQEKWVLEKFSDIPNKNLQRPVYQQVPFDKDNLKKMIRLVPVREEDTIEILWVLPALRDQHQKKICEYIDYLLGFEGKNSLTTFLIDEGLITDLSSYHEHILNWFTIAGIKITLTEEGFEKYEQVVGFIYKYLQNLTESGIQKWQFEEQKKIEEIAFKFLEKIDVSDYVTAISQKMQYIPVQEVLRSRYHWAQYDPKKIQEVLELLNMDNMQIYLSSHSFEEDEEFPNYITEEHYGTRYVIEDLPQEIIEICKNAKQLKPKNTKKQLGISIKNAFIPKQFEVLENQGLGKLPEQLLNSKLGDTWYMQDEKYNIGKGWVSLVIHTNSLNINSSVDGWVQAEMWLYLLENYIQELVDMADSTYLKFSIELIPGGIKMRFKGFNDTLLDFIVSFFEQMTNFDVEKHGGERVYKILYEKCVNEYTNHFKESPETIGSYYCKDLCLLDGRYPMEEKLEALQNLEYENFVTNIKSKWLKQIFIESYFYGNFSKEEVIKCVNSYEQVILGKQQIQKYEKKNILPLRTAVLNQNEILRFQYSLDQEELGNQDEPNSAIQMYFQGPVETPELWIKTKILKNYLSEPFFDQLRTNEQLGYSVYTYDEYIRGISSMNFIIQSSVADPNKLATRILAFLDDIKEKIQKMEDSEFEELKSSVLNKLTEKEDNLYQEALHYYKEIYFHSFLFDRKDQVKDIIEKIEKKDLIEYFIDLFYTQNKRIEVHIISKEHTDSQKENNELRKNDAKIVEVECITSQQKKLKKIGKVNHDHYGPFNLPK